jgi:hypothetical protein
VYYNLNKEKTEPSFRFFGGYSYTLNLQKVGYPIYMLKKCIGDGDIDTFSNVRDEVMQGS